MAKKYRIVQRGGDNHFIIQERFMLIWIETNSKLYRDFNDAHVNLCFMEENDRVLKKYKEQEKLKKQIKVVYKS